ncbi:CsiV family protein [Litoribacillus peritrichatus]|uniref:Peptidoglycan-binding protein CsiV n=1 Tax=Litoribacillus peritrichatus TaxID=718191 RepID=A0ABP7MDZ3_9GAMM
MKITLTPLAVALSLSAFLFCSPSRAENDINASELSKDLQRIPTHTQPNTVAPSNDSLKEPLEPLSDWFKVEVVIFKHLNSPVTEVFPTHVDFQPPAAKLLQLSGFDYPPEFNEMAQRKEISYSNQRAILTPKISDQSEPTPETDAQPPASNTISYHQEPLELLAGAHRQLNKNPNYEVLISTAWKQPMVEKGDAPTMHLVAGNWFDNEPEFEGFLKISKQRYLHAYADLFLHRYSLKTEVELTDTKPLFSGIQPPESTQGLQHHHVNLFDLSSVVNENLYSEDTTKESKYISSEVFYISEDRIMKHSKDLYYLDHPKLGALIKVTPIDQLKAEE